MKIDINSLPVTTCCDLPLRLCVTTRDMGSDAHCDGKVFYIRRNLSRARVAELALGYASMAWQKFLGDKDAKWAEGLMIGKRQVEVKLVRRGIAPNDVLLEVANHNRILVQTSSDTVRLLQALFTAANFTFEWWRKRALKRALRRERPVFTTPAEPEPVARPKRRKRITENLPASENAKWDSDFDAAASKILGEPADGT